MKSWHVYIVQCSRGALYTGIALDVDKRIRQHNAAAGARSIMALGRPVRLVYKERYSNKSDALKREYHIKRLSRMDKLGLIDRQQ
jgi:putative endonuclease